MNTNPEIVKQAYADFLQGNIPALVEKMSDDVVWELPASAEVPFSGVFKGKDGVMRFFKEIATLNDFHEFNLEDVLSGENKVVVTGNLKATSKSTGKTSQNRWAHCWELKEGKVTRHYEYVDSAEIRNAFH